MSCKNNKTSNNKKKFHKIYFESNNKKNIFNKSLYDKKIFKIINSKDNNECGKKTKNKISLITELNKLKLKVKSNCNNNNQAEKKSQKNIEIK